MKPTVAIVAPGRMGSAIAQRLAEHGVEVLTSLAGRGADSAIRAHDAGMRDENDTRIVTSDLLVSIVPPAEALPVARRFAEAISLTGHKPVYVDLNAIAPRTATEVESEIVAAGADFVDGSIIGTLPRAGYDGPRIYLSGNNATKAAVLSDFGLEVEVLDGPAGTASALKMCFAGIMKGLQAVGSASLLAASRAGIASPLTRELERSQPLLAKWFERQIPAMFPKTYRWVAEMQEIAEFLDEDEGRDIYVAASRLFAHLSDGDERSARHVDTLRSLF